jgi:hypothetical protein
MKPCIGLNNTVKILVMIKYARGHSHEQCSDSISPADFQLTLYPKLTRYSVTLKIYAKKYFTRYNNSEVICFERLLTVR